MIEVHIKDPECKKGNYGFITVACGFEPEIAGAAGAVLYALSKMGK